MTHLDALPAIVLGALGLVALAHAVLQFIGTRAVAASRDDGASTAVKDLIAHDYHDAVSVIVPAFDDAATIVPTLRALLHLQHPRFDVTVINDGSTDGTMSLLISVFALHEVPIAHEGGIETAPLRRLYRSADHANLTVVDKVHGGRADALNAGLNLSRRPVVCVVDADVVLGPHALADAATRFVEDPSVVAVTSQIAPEGGWRARDLVQRSGHARRTIAAAAWSALRMGIDADGFVAYRRRALVEIGGFGDAEEMSDVPTLLALHRSKRARGANVSVAQAASHIGRMRPEPGLRAALGRRLRRHRATAAALWAQRSMIGRSRYGRIGLIGLPARLIIDVVAIPLEAAALLAAGLSAVAGTFDPVFATAAIALVVGRRLISASLALAALAVR